MTVHPYIPNSVPEIKRKMLREIGVRKADALFEVIPERIKFKKRLKLPTSSSEYEVKRHIESVLSRNKTCSEMLSFVGAGCWPHYVPAVCDEINARSEFLTAYAGDVYTDLGRYQALFEFQSMIGDLVAMDIVTFPIYDWATASGDAARMAALITKRREILVPRLISPEKLSVLSAYCGNLAKIKMVDYNSETGQLNLEDLKSKISSNTAGVYIENPSYLGFVETHCEDIAQMTHESGALFLVGVEPLSLGVLRPPGEYGADIVSGEGQPLGMHMNFGGALCGFLAFPDDERFVSVCGHRLITLTRTERDGEWGFTLVLPKRTMFAAREMAATFTGTTAALWGITAAVYIALMGPQGMRELAQTIMQKSHYAMKSLSELKGVQAPIFTSPHFEEFTVNFDGVKKTVDEVNKKLLTCGVQGGKDLSKEFPELGNTALYCVTEIHTKNDIDRLCDELEGIVE